MNGITLAVIGLRSAALAIDLAGRATTADSLYRLADLIDAGKATDDHMALVAERLKAHNIGTADFEDVIARIEADSAALQATKPPG